LAVQTGSNGRCEPQAVCHGDVVVCARCAAAAQVDRQLIYGTGTNGQVLGVDFTPGITTIAASMHAYLGIPDILECLAAVAGDDGDHREAARLFGAAQAIRQRWVRCCSIWDDSYQASVTALRFLFWVRVESVEHPVQNLVCQRFAKGHAPCQQSQNRAGRR
jgi:hypothetical protein